MRQRCAHSPRICQAVHRWRSASGPSQPYTRCRLQNSKRPTYHQSRAVTTQEELGRTASVHQCIKGRHVSCRATSPDSLRVGRLPDLASASRAGVQARNHRALAGERSQPAEVRRHGSSGSAICENVVPLAGYQDPIANPKGCPFWGGRVLRRFLRFKRVFPPLRQESTVRAASRTPTKTAIPIFLESAQWQPKQIPFTMAFHEHLHRRFPRGRNTTCTKVRLISFELAS